MRIGMLRIKTISASILLTALSAAQTPHANTIFPLKEIRAGQMGVGRTVFQGTKVEEFQAEILGVLENIGPKENIILARLSGGPLAHTGVMQGMSGSPVWIGGRLIGAVALAFPFSKDPIAGIRPIEEMLALGSPGPAPARAEVKFGESQLAEVATPVSFAGFSARAVEHFAPEWRKMGLAPMQGVGGRASGGSAGAPALEPGSMISVQLVTGDMSVGADGTVTYIDQDRILAFGHRFLSAGSTSMPFARSEVLTLLPNLSSSFKISGGLEQVGAITFDGNAAIAGQLGRKPRMVPVSIDVAGASRESAYRMEMIESPVLSPFLLQMMLFSAIDSTERLVGAATVRIEGEVSFAGAGPALRIDQALAGDANAPILAALAAAAPLSYLLQTATDPLEVDAVRLKVTATESRQGWQVDQLTVSRKWARPGEEIRVGVVLRGAGDRERTEMVSYKVPEGLPPGPLMITAADGTTTNLAEGRTFLTGGNRPARQAIDLLNRLRPNTAAYLRLWRPDPAIAVGGVDFENLPAGYSLVLSKSPAPAGPLAPAASTLKEIAVGAGSELVTGSRTIQLEIKE
jgi:hypothetical protein